MNRVMLYVDEEGYWIAECMKPECAGRAKTKQKALEHVKRAINFTERMWQPEGPSLEPAEVDLVIYECRSRPSAVALN